MAWSLWFALIPFSFLCFCLAWLIQKRTGDAAIVDVFWPYVVGASGAIVAYWGTGDDGRRALLGILALLWGVRLGTHILTDRVLTPGHEDRRYTQMRDDWGDLFQLLIFRFYQYQGISVFGLSLVFIAIAANPAPLGPFAILGALVVVFGVIGETLADQQLQAWRFNPDNKGKSCRGGLWAVSRHPNYFFEWLVWVGWAIMAISTPYWGFVGLLPVGIMYVAMNYFTGIPPNERQNLIARSDYSLYQSEVSAFFPWFPKQT